MKASDDRPVDGWEDHRREQLLSVMTTTPLQRLRWLEEAIAFAFKAGALPKKSVDPSPEPDRSPNAEPT
jgi:hypothetical protein